MSELHIRVLCVDDHRFLVDGMESRLALEKDLEFVGWLQSAEQLLEKIEQTNPRIILMDIEMPGPDPFEVLEDVRRQHPEVRTIMFSAYVRDHFIDTALNAGAWGYLSKSDEPEDVIKAIRSVAEGQFAFGPKVLERCQPTTGSEPGRTRPTSKLTQLTPRELQVLRLIGKGMSRQEIADSVHRSPKTIDNHRAALMEKLGIHDRVELARFAISEGLVEL